MALAFTLGAAVAGGLGWFLIAWLVVHEPAGDAVGEALGVAFGVLIVTSVVGAVRAAARRGSTESADPAVRAGHARPSESTDADGDREPRS
jgi:hypothetical protein